MTSTRKIASRPVNTALPTATRVLVDTIETELEAAASLTGGAPAAIHFSIASTSSFFNNSFSTIFLALSSQAACGMTVSSDAVMRFNNSLPFGLPVLTTARIPR